MRKVAFVSLIVTVVAAGMWCLRTHKHEGLTIQGPALSVRFLDEDHGNALILRTPEGKTAVIDPAPQRVDQLVDLLKGESVRQITVFVCDASYDSARAVADLQAALNVERVIALQQQPEPEQWESTMAHARCRPVAKTLIGPGSTAKLSPCAQLTALDCSAGGQFNSSSCVVRLSYKGKSLLYVSELDAAGEAGLVSSGCVLESNILALGRGADHNNPSLELLSKVRPQTCVLCTRRPWSSVVKRLSPENSGATLFRTDKDGIIEIVTDGRSVQSSAGGGQ